MRPLIGLTTYREEASWGVWRQRADVLHVEYADVVTRAGGVPVLLPPASDDPEDAAAVVARLDGLVITGGADVDPAVYGQAPHERTSGWRPDRDAWELALLRAAAATGLPTLGVCRGMQLMAAAAGGELDQHTPDVVGHEGHGPGGDRFGDTSVTIDPDSLVGRVAGTSAAVRCHHHQSVRSHPGFRATAWAADGTVEAIEAEDDRWCVAIQWHPEMAHGDNLVIDALVAAAAARG